MDDQIWTFITDQDDDLQQVPCPVRSKVQLSGRAFLPRIG
jgi:hypothetical protein